MYSDYSTGGANRIIKTIQKCPKAVAGGLGGFAILLLVCLICFCCSVSSSFGAMYWKRQSLCAGTCAEVGTGDATLNDVAESFRNTTLCNVGNYTGDTIYDFNAYRNRDRGY